MSDQPEPEPKSSIPENGIWLEIKVCFSNISAKVFFNVEYV